MARPRTGTKKSTEDGAERKKTGSALQQMPKPTRTVVKIVEQNWDEIKKSCNYQSGNICPLNDKPCSFSNCELLANKERGGDKRRRRRWYK